MIEARESVATTLRQQVQTLTTQSHNTGAVEALTHEIETVETHIADLVEQMEARRQSLETAFYQLAGKDKCPEKMTLYMRQANEMKAMNTVAQNRLDELTSQRSELTGRIFTLLPGYLAG